MKDYDPIEVAKMSDADLAGLTYEQHVRISDLRIALKDCVNELCLKCGDYHESYLGACDGCRWKKVKEDLR